MLPHALQDNIVIFKIKYTEDKNSHGLYTYSIDRYTDYFFK